MSALYPLSSFLARHSQIQNLTLPPDLYAPKESTPFVVTAATVKLTYAASALLALKSKTNPSYASLFLSRKPIPLVPANPSLRHAVAYEHEETNHAFCDTAYQDYLNKWASAIPTSAFKAHFHKNTFNTHHRWPIFFGGSNNGRTVCDESLHKKIHDDFNETLRLVEHQLCLSQAPLQSFETATPHSNIALRSFLLAQKEVCEKLERIEHVSVQNGIVYADILWPEEKVCLPQLLIFETTHGAPPNDGKPLSETPSFQSLSALSPLGAPADKYFAARPTDATKRAAPRWLPKH